MSLVKVRFLKETFINIRTPTRVGVGQQYEVPALMAADYVEKGIAEYVVKLDVEVNIGTLKKDELVALAVTAGVEDAGDLTVKELRALLKDLSEAE